MNKHPWDDHDWGLYAFVLAIMLICAFGFIGNMYY